MRMRLMSVALATLVGTAAAQNQPWIDLPTQAGGFNSATATRGMQCTAPMDFTVIAVEVPNPNSNPLQSVAVFQMAAKAPAFSASTTLTPSFTALNVPSGQIIPLPNPITIRGTQGEWLGVLGACHPTAGGSMYNPYSTPSGPFATGRVGGAATTVYRFLTQTNISTLVANGTVAVSSEDTGPISQVHVYVVAHGADNAAPNPGNTVTLTCEAGVEATVANYICALSLGTGPIPLPFGTLNLSPDGLFLATAQNLIPTVFANGQGALDANGEGQPLVNIPNLPVLVGTTVYSSFITIPTLTVATTTSFQIS